MLRRTHVWRPSLAGVPWWRRWRVPAASYAVRMARVGVLPVYSPVEDVTLRVGAVQHDDLGQQFGGQLPAGAAGDVPPGGPWPGVLWLGWRTGTGVRRRG
jgi:type IV secretion system protein VirD4